MVKFLICIVFNMLLMANAGNAEDIVDKQKAERGKAIAEELTDMRSNLAKKNIKPKVPVNEDLSNKICVAVAEAAKRFNGEEFPVRFVSTKIRNPENVADDDEKHVLRLMKENPDLKESYLWKYIGEKEYWVLLKAIYAETPCLVCHGDVKKRPEFIIKKYPEDKSFGFKEGELMGATEVFIRSNR